MNEHHLYRIVIALLGTVLLGCAAYASGKRGLADWESMRWRHEIDGWTERRLPPAPERMQEAIETLSSALALTPQDPDLIEHLGVAYELRTAGSPPDSESRRFDLTLALDYFRKAAAMRPTSAYTWANILRAKYQLGEVDGEFFGAMRHALDFGPWEPAVQLIVADAGLGAWERLDSGLRARVSENLQRAASRQASALARIATDRHRIELVCAASFDRMKTKVKCPT